MLRITVPGRDDILDEETGEIYSFPDTVLEMENSLVSISKWEAKFKKSFFRKEEKSHAEVLYYIKCMTLNSVPWYVYRGLTRDNEEKIRAYLENPHTATVIRKNGGKGPASTKFMTSELLYYYMTELNIPFIPCENWNINRLLTLIDVCCEEKKPKKKMSSRDVASQYRALNAARRKH